MNRKQLAIRIDEIQNKNNHLKRMRYWMIFSALIGLICIVVAWWGFGNIQDPILPNLSQSIRTPIAWVTSVIGFIAVLFLILVYIALRNGKKHVLTLIDELERGKR
jgi:TRAP-type C4-dicarboxylate transport system permease small subunit